MATNNDGTTERVSETSDGGPTLASTAAATNNGVLKQLRKGDLVRVVQK